MIFADAVAHRIYPGHGGTVLDERQIVDNLVSVAGDYFVSHPIALVISEESIIERLRGWKDLVGTTIVFVWDHEGDASQAYVFATLFKILATIGMDPTRISMLVPAGVHLSDHIAKEIKETGLPIRTISGIHGLDTQWYDWEAQHATSNAHIGLLPTFGSPQVCLPLIDAVLRFKPQDIYVVHAFKLGFVALFASCSHHLSAKVHAINPQHYKLAPFKSQIKDLELDANVRYIEWDPFVAEEQPPATGCKRPMIFLNVNAMKAIRGSLAWLLADAEEALIVFHATSYGDTPRFLESFRKQPEVTLWPASGTTGHWCEGGFVVWKPLTTHHRRIIVEHGIKLFDRESTEVVTDYEKIVSAATNRTVDMIVLYMSQDNIKPIQNMLFDQQKRFDGISWVVVADDVGRNVLPALGLLRILKQRGSNAYLFLPGGAVVDQEKIDVARRFGVDVVTSIESIMTGNTPVR